MSTQVLPSFSGQGWSITRAPTWKKRQQMSVSGKVTVLSDFSYPIWQWDLVYNVLRQGAPFDSTMQEASQLIGFFNQMYGGFDSFLYQDQDDNQVLGQFLGVGDGTTGSYVKPFQLIRSFGGFVEPILAALQVSNVKLNGVVQTPGSAWNWATWGGVRGVGGGAITASPGSIWFSPPPGVGVGIVADITYYFPCRFIPDGIQLEKFAAGRYMLKKLSFQSIK